MSKATNVVDDGPVDWDPYNPQYFANPYPAFRKLREQAPVYYNERYDFYAVSRYADVQKVLLDRDTFISGRGDVLEFIQNNVPMPKGMFISEDPPLHTIHRGLLTRVFTPKKMAELEPKIRAFCAAALDPLVDGGEFDFVEDLGAEMPMQVIGMLLGIPDEDLKKVQGYIDDSTRTEPGKPLDTVDRTFTGGPFDEYIEWRAKHPSDDLMTQLLNAEFEDETGTTRRLTREEVLVFINILAGAGNETTNRLIGWTGKLLAEHPEQRRQIQENRALIPQAIEEILRYEPPGPSVARYVARDTDIHGVKIPEGSAILALVGAANRDEEKFVDGETFNIHRERVPHMTFGYGHHNCLGNALARVEGRVALDEFLNRFPDWNVDMSQARLISTSTTRGWETLPAFTPTAKRGTRAKQKAATARAPDPVPEGAESWALTMEAPTGPQELTAHIMREGGTLSGRLDMQNGPPVPISDGKIDGNTASWTAKVKGSLPVTLTFKVTLEGDAMSGTVKFGMFGKGEVTGQRIAS